MEWRTQCGGEGGKSPPPLPPFTRKERKGKGRKKEGKGEKKEGKGKEKGGQRGKGREKYNKIAENRENIRKFNKIRAFYMLVLRKIFATSW